MAEITFTERDRRDGDARHGTPSGANRHSLAGEPPCDACRAARAEYDKRRLAAPDKQRANRMTARAQMRALKELKDAHPDEYRAAYLKHKKALVIQQMREATP